MKSVISSISWKFTEKIAAQLVSFIVSIVLARLLLPEQYGIIAKVTVFITVADVLVTTGLGSSLVQNKDVVENDFSTMFFVNLFFSALIYSFLFFCAPLISNFFDDFILIKVLRILGLKVLLSSYVSIQQAYISKNLLFKKSAIASFLATIVSAIVGIVIAITGFGVWALVWQQLSFTIAQVLLLTIFVKWKPRFVFSITRAKSFIGFGNMILIAGMLDTIAAQVKTVLIGKNYTDSDLAYFNRGDLYPQLLISSLSGALHTVLFVVYSNEQDRLSVVKDLMRKGIRRSCFIIFAVLIGLASVAKPLVEIMLTSKWLPCVPYLQLACLGYCTWPIQIVEQEAIMGLGYGKDYLRITILRTVFTIGLLFVFVRHGILVISLGVIIYSLFSTVLVCAWNRKKINYSFREQISDILPGIENALLIAITVYLISFVNLPTLVLLILEIFGGVLITIIFSIVTKNETFFWILGKVLHKSRDYNFQKNDIESL